MQQTKPHIMRSAEQWVRLWHDQYHTRIRMIEWIDAFLEISDDYELPQTFAKYMTAIRAALSEQSKVNMKTAEEWYASVCDDLMWLKKARAFLEKVKL